MITAAETGHLVFSTLHTNSAAADRRPHPRHLPARPADAGARPARAGAQGRGLDEAGRARSDGSGLVAALEILRASPKIAQADREGRDRQLHEEIESSVGYYRMQSMNQSLLALLVHGTITYAEAMRAVDRSRRPVARSCARCSPSIEERGGRDEPSPPISREILELQQYRKLYEEQEEKIKLRLGREGRARSPTSTSAIGTRDEQIEELAERARRRWPQERERMRGDYDRLRQRRRRRSTS